MNTLSNPVPFIGSIANSPANPVPVRIQQDETPVTLTATISDLVEVGVVPATNLDDSLFSVPAGKRLVVDYVSAEMDSPPDQPAVMFGIMEGKANVVRIPFGPGVHVGDQRVPTRYAGGQRVEAYVEAKSQVAVFCERVVADFSDLQTPQCVVSIVGHLEDAP
ncbi:MAG: hypothetical protein ACM3QY_13750 [Candidatus Levyibacteriota bacterium]